MHVIRHARRRSRYHALTHAEAARADATVEQARREGTKRPVLDHCREREWRRERRRTATEDQTPPTSAATTT
jgi:hypothetical protein